MYKTWDKELKSRLFLDTFYIPEKRTASCLTILRANKLLCYFLSSTEYVWKGYKFVPSQNLAINDFTHIEILNFLSHFNNVFSKAISNLSFLKNFTRESRAIYSGQPEKFPPLFFLRTFLWSFELWKMYDKQVFLSINVLNTLPPLSPF